MHNNRVLVIAFIFPPLGGSGVQRSLKFVKYLPEFGWQPYVVCSDDPHAFGDGLDPSLVDDIPATVQVWRRPFVNPLGFRRGVQKWLGITPRKQITLPGGSELIQSPSTTENASAKSGLRRFFQLLTGPLAPFEFPPVDAALYWALAIVPACLRLIRREKIDLIFSTSFPYSDHLTGYLLKELTGKPWIADFRDPWTQNASARNPGWRYRVDRWVEQQVLLTADRVVGVTPTYTADLRRLAPARAAEHFVTIENGYDEEDFNQLNPSSVEVDQRSSTALPPDETASQRSLAATEEGDILPDPSRPITLAHVGYLYAGTALPLFQALENLGEAAARLQLRFIGGLAGHERQWLDSHKLNVKIQIEPRQSHAQALAEMCSADLLLLFALGENGRSGHYPGKLFEYMASGTPVLLVGPEGDAAGLIRRSGAGLYVPAVDAAAILDVLRQLVDDPAGFREGFYHPQPEIIAVYQRKALTNRLAAIFNDLSAECTRHPFTARFRVGSREKAGN